MSSCIAVRANAYQWGGALRRPQRGAARTPLTPSGSFLSPVIFRNLKKASV